MLQTVGDQVYIVVAILRFLQGYIFVYESLYLHYLCRSLQHYDVGHGSPVLATIRQGEMTPSPNIRSVPTKKNGRFAELVFFESR